MKQIIHQTKTLMLRAIKNKKRIVAILSLLLVFSMLIVTFSWYKNQVSLGGSTFSTGTLDFIATGFDQNGSLMTTVLQQDKDASGYEKVNQPLFTKNNWQAGTTETAFLAIENTGSLPMDFKVGFTAAGEVEYLGGYWYALTDITSDLLDLSGTDSQKLQTYANNGYVKQTEQNGYNMATMDRYATMGNLDSTTVNKRYYRLDYGMKESAIVAEYTNKTVEVFMHIYVTQPGAFDADAGTGYTYNCSTVQDIDKAKEHALPGDNIRLLNNITYEGDLVFNKAVNLITNNFTLEVLGNLIYNYVAPTSLTINATGNGRVVVASPGEGVGGNFTVTTPNSDVTLLGGNSAVGDIAIDGKCTLQATHAYGAAGVTLSAVKFVNYTSSTAIPVYVNSNTRVTVADNTTVYRLVAVANASNVEIQNAGTIQNLVLSAMNLVSQTTSPQIDIVNMGNITNTIQLPVWSERFVTHNTIPVTYSGNTRIVQTITGNNMTVSGADQYDNDDIEQESSDITVAPVGNGNGSLIVYYQDIEIGGVKVTTSVQSLLEKYFTDLGLDAGTSIQGVTSLQIISIGDKAVTTKDIEYIKGSAMSSLRRLDLQRATVIDSGTSTLNRLGTNALAGADQLTELILPQNLEQIGVYALSRLNSNLVVTIPASVTVYGDEWYNQGKYVAFASPTPVTDAIGGMDQVQAIFVDETYVEAYRTAFSSFLSRIYPMAQQDDTGTHFVRQLSGTTSWEIVCYVGLATGDINVGNNIRVGGQPISIVGIGDYSYCNTLIGTEPVVTFADSIEYIGERAFYETTVTKIAGWGTHLKTIEPWAFYKAARLSEVADLPASMETIGSHGFDGCSSLVGINTGGTTTLGIYMFQDCSALLSVQLPHVEIIGDNESNNYTFSKCSKLVSVSAPSLYQVNGGYTFNKCTSLREIIMGSDQPTVSLGSSRVFEGTSSSRVKLFADEDVLADYRTYTALTQTAGIPKEKMYPTGVKMGDNSAEYGYNIGEYIVSDKLNGDGTVTLITSNLSYSGAVTLPNVWNGKPITAIYDNAFRNQTFTDVTLTFGNNLQHIGTSAFEGLSGIVGDLILPDGMRTLGDRVFYGCKGLTSLHTGGTTTIGSTVFATCSNAVTANLPYVTTIGNNVDNAATFSSCTSLVSVSVPKLTTVYKTNLFSSCNNLREIIMGSTEDGLTLGSTPFGSITAANKKLIKLYVPADALDYYISKNPGSIGVGQIYEQGIKYGTNSLNGYNLGEYIYSVNADHTATLITSTLHYSGEVSLPDSFDGYAVSVIGRYAFANQTFTDVSLSVGSYVDTVQPYGFYGLQGLTAVDLRNTKTLSGYCFYTDSGLTTLVADKLVNMAGGYNFNGCTALTAVNLTELVTMDGGRNFYGCTAMTSARLTKLQTMEGTYNFAGCSKLETVYFEQIISFTNYDFNNTGSMKEFILNKVITASSDLPKMVSGSLRLSAGNVVVPMAYRSFYSTNWQGRPVVTLDKIYTDESGNQYFILPNGNECTIGYFMGNATTLTVPSAITIDGTEYAVTSIDPGAFKSVSAMLTSITLPAKLHTFKTGTLSEIAALTAIQVDAANRSFVAKNGVLYTKDGRMLLYYPKGNAATTYTVDNQTMAIGAHAFDGAANLTAVTFGSGLTAIDSTAFEGCTPASVTFNGTTPPVLMGTGIFDSTVTGFAITVPQGQTDAYIRGVHFTEYADYINNGVAVPATGDMNQTPWSASGVVETAALPPQASKIPLHKKEDEDDDTLAL